jgi:hypothetical protein
VSKIKWWDEYEIKARYIPTFISVVPFVHFAILFLGGVFWEELIKNLSWMLVITNLSASLLVMLAFVQFQCTLGKIWIEESVFGKGGERFPTTDMLLYTGGLISIQRKEQLRALISKHFNCIFSSEDEENSDPFNARLLAREAVGHVRKKVGQSTMTLQYNIRYGFFRNLIAGMPVATIGGLGCSILYFIKNSWKPMSLFAAYTAFFLFIYLFKKLILDKIAYSYADTLYNEYSNCP